MSLAATARVGCHGGHTIGAAGPGGTARGGRGCASGGCGRCPGRSAQEGHRRRRRLLSDRRLQRSGADPARARRERAGHAYAGPRDRRARAAGGNTARARARRPDGRGRTRRRRRRNTPVRARDQPRGGHRPDRTPPCRRSGRTDPRGRRAGCACARVRRHRQPPLHGPVRVGAALGAPVAGGRDPASPAAGVVYVRGGAVHARGLAGAGRETSAGTRSTSRWIATRCISR